MYIFQVTTDLSDNLECLNGKLTALNKFINQLKDLSNWAILKKLEVEKISQTSFPEKKLAAEKLQVNILSFL